MAIDVPATNGTAHDRMITGVEMSERARVKALQRAHRVRTETIEQALRRDAQLRRTRSRVHIEVSAARCADDDTIVKAEIATEQWGGRLATMYGITYLTELANETNAHLRELCREMRRSNALLERLACVSEANHHHSS